MTTEPAGPARPAGAPGATGATGSPADPRAALREDVVARLRAAGCVFAEEEADLLLAETARPADGAVDAARLDGLVRRRAAGAPLEHLLGYVDLDGRRYAVGPGVFVPRQRTALLVAEAARLAPPGAGPVVVVDLCCGCGALGAAVAHRLVAAGRQVSVHAADVDPLAVAYAGRNLAPLGGTAVAGDLDAPLPAALRGHVDLLVANVPYVPSDAVATLPPEARLHEPRVALDGGADGLDVARRVAAAAPRWLRPGGHLLVEAGEDQLPAAHATLRAAGLVPRTVRDEEAGATVVVGTLPA